MKKLALAILQTILVVSLAPKYVHGQSLSPPAINIAQGKKIQATATCGEDVGEPELFCKLATVAGKFEILGLSCDHCDPSVSSKNHSIQHAIDGTEKWWQSPPLSRGLQYQRVNITIDLGQEYQVAYVIIKTGNAPRPGTWALEKSVDGGKTFTPWQYFATDNSDCLTYFGHSALLQSFKDDTTVTCTTSYSQVPPFENGEIHISLVNGRPGASNFSYSQALQEWTRATHIRLRLLKVKTLLTDLLPLARKDPSVTRRYFYSIKDISVGGICMCNGHADACVQLPGESQFRCSCKHQTCGVKCEECCPGFVQKKWRPATAESSNECEPCNCHNHAIDCYYSERIAQERRSLDINGNYEGGGVCVNCQHNTYGINCESCKPGYYRPTGVPKTSPDACQACTCDRRFSTGRCFDGDGRCECLENYSGPNCDQCNEGFYGFPNCKPCDCHPLGTSGRVCGPSGDQCPCKPNYTGAKCDQCAPGYYGFPDCRRCNCDTVGSLSSDCEITSGQCTCRQMYTGRQCNQCSRGFYSFPECKVCNCDGEGTDHDICDPNTGVCICMKNFAGPRCDVCNEGYYGFPECKACGCSAEGSVSPKCNQAGVCECKENYDVTTTKKCDRCRVGYYSYPRCVKCSCDPRGSVHQFCDPETGQCTCKGSFRGLNCNRCRSGYYGFPDCQRCQCNPAGIKPLPDGQLVDCSLSNEGQCNCKDNVQGLACTECKDGYYFLQSSNPLGCNNCDCNMDGVIGGLRTCDKFTGQCPCKLYVAGRKCTSCKAGFYGLAGSKVFGCTGCDCDVGGAYNQFCDITSGQCMCRPNVVGRDCSRPAPRHYYPTLFHTVAELEDATAVPTKQGSEPGQDVLSPDVSPDSEGTPARFGFDESEFPGYSWRGYATMSDLQRALKVTLDIPKTARYHLIFHSITNESSPVTGKVMLTPKGGSGSKQSSPVTFPVKQVGSANVPTHHTVGDKGMATQFMLTKGQWDLMLVLPPASVLLDYVTALPQEYYEAYRLEDKVTKPCQVNGINTLCNQFSYLSTNKPRLFTTELETGYIIRTGGKLTQTQLFKDEAVLQQLDFSAMALLDDTQNRVTADFKIPKSGKYVFVLQYYHPSDNKAKLSVYLRYPQGTQQGEFNLQRCNFRFGCRQVAVDSNGAVKVFDVPRIQRMVVTLLTRDSSSPMALDSITAIPLDMWSLDYIAPSILCTTQGSVCIPTSYPNPKGAVKIEADDTSPSDPQPPNKQDPSVKLQYLKGPKIHVLTGPVPRPGQYAAIVHYYQPNHASFDSRVTVTSDRALDGSMKFHYCPHASGCRSVVRDLNASPFFNIGRSSVALEFNIPENASTWIDYVLLVPQAAFTEELQEDAPVPLTQAFLDSCSKDDFFIKPSDPQFCKDSVFSLTTAFINGSLSCDCNLKGSLNSDCQQYGGQCPCRPNVIGRTCSRCKTGYYGFPNCRKCRCVFCNEITGACDCPPNTVGPNCEFCLQGTCCYDPILGCQDCGCERFGVKGGDIACSANTGQCNCKPSHTGKKCNKCATGYFNYPLCQKCDSCDPRGVDSRICNSDDGTCFCKPGVTGPRCDQCAAGRFNLDANNPDGCSECWCNGLTDTCDSGDKYWSKIDTMDNWQLENSPAIVVKIGETNLYASISSQRDEKGKPIYWLAPKEFLGQKISSYGGKLSYTTRYEVPQGEGSPVLTTRPDVVIEGKNGKVLSYRRQLQLSPGKTTSFELQFLEYLWVDASGANVSRDDFMSVFSDIQSLKLRASYSTVVAEVTLNDVKMDVAVDGPLAGAARANSVEMCICPERATGASCELCGKGFTRAADNTTCVPCNCFGHSDDCDGETGICNNCLHNTTGPDCGECELGYYGDATVGSEQDCRICECPLGIMSNSFATECALDPFRDLSCKCQEGYEGQRCEKCADGFYGNPSQPGDYCKRCYCSGNIDTSVNGSCDTQTGQCLKCINAATGDQCDRCLDGYFGDAVVAKNCARCACSDCGTVTAVCYHTTGACKCKPNVIGDSCDSCTPNTWNFDSCLGCEDCACAPASLSASCDVKTGQCKCPEGVTGRQCDRCKAGFFGYSAAGCQPCNCPKGEENLFGFCDVNTGQCCKPGGNCTICPYNYILMAEGCEYCGECVERLLNTSTELDRKLTQALKSLEQGTAGIIAEGRFKDINETLQRLIPPTNEYNTTMEEVHMLVGVSSVAVPPPLAIYPLNGKHGGKDIGPNSNREAKLSNAPLVAGPYGESNGARQLKGRPDSYIEIPNEGSLDSRRSTSILVWVYHKSTNGPIVDYGAYKPVNLWLINSKYRLQFLGRDRRPPTISQISQTVPPNVWNHVAATYNFDSGLSKFWVNEKLEDVSDIGIKELATDGARVMMGRLQGLPLYFKGHVACLQIYNNALTKEQIEIAKYACDPVNSSSTDIAGSGLTKRTESSEATTERVEQIVRKLTERATKASENATSTKDEALTLEEEIKDALNRTRDIISFAERIANTLKTDKANQTLLLEEAEEILKELVNRNFDAANATMSEEEELVMSAMNRAKTMLNDTVSLWSQLMDANKTLSELLGKFGSILDKTRSVLENTSHALETNNISKSYDSETPLRDAGKKKQEVDIALMGLMDVIETTKSKLFNGSSSLQSFNGSFPRLDDLIDQVTKRMANISQAMDQLVPSVVMAQNHSDELRKQADELEKLLTDIEFANKAVNASQRYSAIADALKEALAIAQEAEEIAMDARDESQNVSNLAWNSQNVSSELNESAIQTKDKVDKELSNLLDDIKNRLDLIRRKIQNVSEDLMDVTKNFDEFEEMANVISEKTKELGENATQSQKVADDAWEKADEIDKQLVGLSGLKESIIATNSNITEAEDKVMDALNTSKVIKDKVVVQELRQEKIIEQLDTEVLQRLNDIRQMMDQAHVLLKHTSIVMKFDGKTSSSPLLPQAVQRDTRSLNFLTYIKPEKPDGLVLFMGDAQGSNRKKRQSQAECGSDFIAVELKASKPILKMCTSGKFLDYGAKKDILTDGKRWYKLQAGMTGNLATMSITHYDETQKKTVSENLPARGLRMVNPMMMFNKQSDLVVGGVPRNMKLPPQVDAVNYTGCFDGLQINDHFVGSWNSDPLEISPNVPIEDRYCFSRSGDAGFAAKANDPSRTFFGTGFLKSGPYSAEDIMGDLSFKFKTTSSNGILVIGIDDDDTSLFQAMELSDGHVTFKYNMGSGFRWLYSKNVYDTGDEVTIEKTTNIFGDRFDLIISSSQGQEVLAKDLPVYKGATRAPSWVNADYVYWGGIANRTSIPANVTKSFFKGCLTDLRLNNGDVKIQASPGFVLGCQVKPAYNVTFLKDHSYLSIKPFLDTRRRGFNIGLSFRVPPRTKSGLMFLEAHGGSRDFIILGLVEGKLTFSASTGGVPLTLQTTNKLNDGKWHFVSVQKDGIIIHLYVDRTKISGQFQDEMQQYIQTTQDMYLGGVPAGYMDTVRNRNFESVILNSLKGGSVRDLTFEDDLFNFMDYKARNDVIFDNDDYSEQTPKNLFIETTVSPRTTALPIEEIKSTPRSQTTTEVQSTTPESTTTTMPSTTESTTTTMPSTTERVTTTPPPTTTTPPPTTQPPVCPMPDTPAQQTGVMGFGHDPYSHAVYTITKDSPLNKLISTRTRLSFEFRASNPNGILLYTANPTQADFIECHLEEGKVSCSFSAGGGILALTSPQNSYSDGNWHNVRLMRREKNGTLSVNGKKVATGKADGSPTFINSLSVVYVGGTPDDFDTKRVTPASRISFPGCIRNITVNNLDIGEPTTKIKTQNCYQDSPSRGVLFSDGGGFLEAADRYSVGRDEIIKLEIKPTSHTGLLLSSFSAKGDYIVLEMIRGNLIFRAENGGGQLVVEYAADNPLDLCDGQWHTVQAWKESNVVRLQVDDGAILEGGGKGSQTGADIFDPLYVGGLPDEVKDDDDKLKKTGVTATEPFTGCIRNLESKEPGQKDGKTLRLANPLDMSGNVFLGGCPYN